MLHVAQFLIQIRHYRSLVRWVQQLCACACVCAFYYTVSERKNNKRKKKTRQKNKNKNNKKKNKKEEEKEEHLARNTTRFFCVGTRWTKETRISRSVAIFFAFLRRPFSLSFSRFPSPSDEINKTRRKNICRTSSFEKYRKISKKVSKDFRETVRRKKVDRAFALLYNNVYIFFKIIIPLIPLVLPISLYYSTSRMKTIDFLGFEKAMIDPRQIVRDILPRTFDESYFLSKTDNSLDTTIDGKKYQTFCKTSFVRRPFFTFFYFICIPNLFRFFFILPTY